MMTPVLLLSTNTAICVFASGSNTSFASTNFTGCYRNSAVRPKTVCNGEFGPQGQGRYLAPSARMHIGTVNMSCAIITTPQAAAAVAAHPVHAVKGAYNSGDARANRLLYICAVWHKAIDLNGKDTGAAYSAPSAGRICPKDPASACIPPGVDGLLSSVHHGRCSRSDHWPPIRLSPEQIRRNLRLNASVDRPLPPGWRPPGARPRIP